MTDRMVQCIPSVNFGLGTHPSVPSLGHGTHDDDQERCGDYQDRPNGQPHFKNWMNFFCSIE